MNFQLLKENIAGVDIYIIDQILKERFQSTDKILDVGCGNGRNLKWFYNAGFEIHGTEINYDRIAYCKSIYPLQQQNFIVAKAQHMPYTSESFNHIICMLFYILLKI
ncbi:class I SAM-dependent methyltransferase [Lutibacter sp. A64]|uniref:class I SAM-dependent methyltransferase n=1 Tax=Lutibacter sp. A64 TaxID=2918526 RepID=UPI001F069FFC|nr:class I SAM-dependent methyltransferase [Lutibacter sp. A64]UMB54654.1 class I SAM-dependent methyltransferase [Lutibacter sp. A64]